MKTAADGTITVGANAGGPYVIRLAADGQRIWATSLPLGGSVVSVELGPEGQAYVLAVFNGGATGNDAAIHRVNADGTVAWSRQYDGPHSGSDFNEFDVPVDLAVTSQGRVFMTARTGTASATWYTWSLMLSADGELLWQRSYQRTSALLPVPKRAAADCNGNVYVVGDVTRNSGSSVGIPGFLLSYGPDGTLRQEATLAPPTGGTIVSSNLYLSEVAAECTTGAVYVAGNEAVQDSQTGGRRDAFVARFDGTATAPTWKVRPYSDPSGGGNSSTEGVHNLAVGGPDAIYANAEVGSTNRVETVRLRSDGSLAWTYAMTNDRIRRPLAANANGVVAVTSQSGGGFTGYHYRGLTPDGALDWEVSRDGTTTITGPGNRIESMAAHPDGGAVWLEQEGHIVRAGEAAPAATAEVLLVHASAAIAIAGPIEVYVNQPPTSTTPDATLAYPGGSSLTIPAGVPLSVRVRLQSAPPPPFPQEFTFAVPPIPEGRHVVTIAGIPQELLALFAQNPEGLDRVLRLVLAALGAGAADGAPGASPAFGADVAVVVTNAVTDAPAVDVVVAGTGEVLGDDLSYGEAGPAVTLAPGTYRVEVKRSSDGVLLNATRFTLDGTEGAVAFPITGFLDPAANLNGPALALVAVDTTGAPDAGVVVTGAEGGSEAAGLALTAPNPAATGAAVRWALPSAGPARLVILDLLGREVARLAEGEHAAGSHTALLPSGLAPGVYVVRLTTETVALTRRLTVTR